MTVVDRWHSINDLMVVYYAYSNDPVSFLMVVYYAYSNHPVSFLSELGITPYRFSTMKSCHEMGQPDN